ncbi:MAG: hypothetical protein ABT940_10025, partial [Alphaproteobacteria bacterium]
LQEALGGDLALNCAAMKGQFRRGVLVVERGFVAENRRRILFGGGTVNFGSETIDLSLRQRSREAASVSSAGSARLLRIRGGFSFPRVSQEETRVASSSGESPTCAAMTGKLDLSARARGQK